MNKTILRTEDLKAFYVLDEFGTQKVVQSGQRGRSRYPGERSLWDCRRKRLRQDDAAESALWRHRAAVAA